MNRATHSTKWLYQYEYSSPGSDIRRFVPGLQIGGSLFGIIVFHEVKAHHLNIDLVDLNPPVNSTVSAETLAAV